MKWIGADWDSVKCVVAYEDSKGGTRKAQVKRHPDAVAEFLGKLEDKKVTVGIEDGDRLWQRLWKNAGAKVFVFDGKKARRFSESLHASGARDDRRAAKDLLEMVKSKPHRARANTPRKVHQMTMLQMDVEIATKKVVEHAGRLVSLLKQYHPALGIALQKRMRNEYALRIIELCPTAISCQKLGKAGNEELATLTRSSRTAYLRKAAGEDWGAVLVKEEAAVAGFLRAEVGSLRHALLRKRAADKALADAAQQSPLQPLVGDIKGIGPYVLAALTIAADTDEGAHRDGIAVLLGAAPVTRRSGKIGDASPSVSMRRACSSTLQKSAHILGMQLVKHVSFARAQYDYLRARGKRAADAFRRIVRSFSRVLHAVVRDGKPFDEELYIASLKQRGVVWAQAL